jgi:hypothetical protein
VPRPRRQLTAAQRRALEHAWQAQLEMEDARRRRDEHASEAAGLGASWREIGAAVAMSPQAAHKRYAHGRPPGSRPESPSKAI